MQSMLDRGQVDGVIRVLPGFARDVERGRATSVQVLLDGTNSNTASHRFRLRQPDHRALFAARSCRSSSAPSMVAATMTAGGADVVPDAAGRSRAPASGSIPICSSRNYFIPGVVVNIITLVTLSLTAMAIVREKEIGTMEQLMVTPIRPIELILGKTLPFVLVGFWDMLLVMGAALLIFHVPFQRQLLAAAVRGARCSC